MTTATAYHAPGIPGWTSDRELSWLHDRGAEMRSVVEVGSYRGRSTHALASGCRGTVYAVDSWARDCAHFWERPWHREDAYTEFLANVRYLPQVRVIRADSLTAAAKLPDVDMVFIDAGHTYRSVYADLVRWAPKARVLVCGHDYDWWYRGVVRAVDEVIGPVERVGRIWFAWR